MPRSFLEVFPREIRDQIYTFVLASPSGIVSLSPWTVEVARSLLLLRTCKQIHRECKDVIWEHNKLTSHHSPTELFQKWSTFQVKGWKNGQIRMSLELLDRDELEWVISGLRALAAKSPNGIDDLRSVTLSAESDTPNSVTKFEELLLLRRQGSKVDGRFYREKSVWTGLTISSIWPPFAHWGKHKWLREILLDASHITELLKEMHDLFGGQLLVDGRVCFKDHKQIVDDIKLDPRDGRIQIVCPRP